jgi:Fe-S oxidoreductase
MWLDERQGTRMNVARATEMLATLADQIVTACPFCATMLSDAVDGMCNGNKPTVKDVCEVIELACAEEEARPSDFGAPA